MARRKNNLGDIILSFLDWLTVTKFVIIVALIAISTSLILSFVFRPKVNILESEDLSSIKDRAVLRFAVHGEVPGFSFAVEDEKGRKTWRGLEVDIGRKIASVILEDENSVEVSEGAYPVRNYLLNNNKVDFIIGLSPLGYSASQIYSEPYYRDKAVVIVNIDGVLTLNELHNSPKGSRSRIGAIVREPSNPKTENPLEHEGALTVLQAYDESNKADFNIIKYAGAPDMFDDLRKGKIDALVIEEALLGAYIDPELMRPLVDHVGTIDYAIAVSPENMLLIEVINQTISEMKTSGELQALQQEYDLAP